ncbi:MAG: hypothetical protein JJE25_09510, partial [Bacteroidia bacterium]|nr:hypothetical protein [Bacteroidia bacterium]
MDNQDTNHVNMIRTTHDFCKANPAPTAGIAAFAPLVATVHNKLTLIDGLDIIAMGSTTGVTLDTNLLRSTMSDIAYKCAAATFAYAASVNNNTLMAQVKQRRSEFDSFKKEEVDDICQGIHDVAHNNIALVSPFGITPIDVTDLQTAIDLYIASIQGPRQARITIGNAKSQIKEIIKDTIQNIIKNQMDRMVDTLKLSNKIFYDKYYLAREIIDLGSTTTKIRGTIKDNEGNPLPNAIVSLFLTGEA